MLKPLPVIQARDFDDVSDEFDFVYSHYFKTRRWSLLPSDRTWRPATDLYESESEFVIIMDIAGITAADVSLKMQDKILTIRGIRREKTGETKRHFHKMEIDHGLFERRIEIPKPVDPEKTRARYSQGFLEIHLPKIDTMFSGKVMIEIS
ncbi:Hsp20/alpha crystallin family protein [bacterium]|nr:Hsp20/alpha crystallin family protein [bacterium]